MRRLLPTGLAVAAALCAAATAQAAPAPIVAERAGVLITLPGGEALTEGRAPAISPDGSRLAFVRGRDRPIWISSRGVRVRNCSCSTVS